jgi:hypothetical protein
MMAATDAYATIEELLEAVFSVRSVPRLYNWHHKEPDLDRCLGMPIGIIVSVYDMYY